MTRRQEVLHLAPGVVLWLDGVQWTVEAVEAQLGRVVLCSADGQRQQRPIRWLVHHPDCRPVAEPGAAAGVGVRQPATWGDLTDHQQEVVRLRAAHLLEVETGFRGGDSRRAGPGEPRREYDPDRTTLGQRRRAKVAELQALGGDEARLLGLGRVSERTLKRLAAAWRRAGVAGCVDGRWLRPSSGHPSISEAVREAIFAVRAESLHRSRMSMRARERLIHQYVRERCPPGTAVPGYDTLRAVWAEWFGPGGARQRYVRSAAAVETSTAHVVVHRPGQVVALDTTPLPVKVRETVFGESVSTHLTLALDVYTHSLVAFRLTLVSEASVDVAMLLRDVMMPLPLRADWGADMEWPYPGVPAAVVAQFAGYPVAALPFFAPETVTTDHGSVFKNHHLVEAERVLGCNILPARALRPTDKQALERAFGAVRSLLFELLLGYTGVDVADRGVDPEADAVLTVASMENLIATWVVKVWQNRRLGEHAPAWGPGEEHSPNSLFAAAMAQGGFGLQVPRPELYYELLPAHYVMIHGRRGVKIRGLWYDGPALDPYRGRPSTRGGRHKGKWVVRSDRRDRRSVFFCDPDSGAWHVLRWNGLPPQGEVPAFTDATAVELLRQARQRGISPQADTELLPVLLDLVGGLIPVDKWPTQMSKSQRGDHARKAAQAQAAQTDRPADPAAAKPAAMGEVVELRWPARARQTADVVDAERRRRRENAVPERPQPPPLLGEALRRRSLFLIPDDEDDEISDDEDDEPARDGPAEQRP
jgi:hypothetical protein